MAKFKLTRPPTPKEGHHQEIVFGWARNIGCVKWPELNLMFATLNGVPIFGPQKYAIIEALRKRGMRKGVLDIFLPAQRLIDGIRYAGLFVEMKRDQNSKVEDEQNEFIAGAEAAGYACAICVGADDAIETIKRYLSGEKVI